jgi:hypothetical protein
VVFNIILLATVDANYIFRYAHVGMKGSTFDGVFLLSAFYNSLTSGVLNVPQPSGLTGNDTFFPYVLVADGAFPLTSYLIKPFAGYIIKGSPKSSGVQMNFLGVVVTTGIFSGG